MSWLVRTHADDFFEAYKALKKYSDTVILRTMGPTVVNLAFAVELYIKDLHIAVTGATPRGHNILNLFRELPEETQREIRDYPSVQKIVSYHAAQTFPLCTPVDKNKQPITDIWEQQLFKISDAFQKWRYSYENGTLKFDESIALAFLDAVKSVADNARGRLVA